MKIYLFFFIFIFGSLDSSEGKLVNPITDICWECLFPITVSGVNITPQCKESAKYSSPICSCGGTPPKIGIPLTFWEPSRLVDVTRHPYKLLGLGGISIGNESVKNRGTISNRSDGQRSSFYHVHWYLYPLLGFLEVFSDFACVSKGELGVAYLSEFDPSWNDDLLSFILNPEAALFASPIAQLSCVADCASANFNKAQDKLFWCAGCQGSLYPFTGTVSHHVGALQASSLLLHRLLAKLHRVGFVRGFNENDFCKSRYMPTIKKSIYKTQLVYPLPQTKGPCHVLGKSDFLWGTGKSFPVKGEDFIYLIWKKKQCCLSPFGGFGD